MRPEDTGRTRFHKASKMVQVQHAERSDNHPDFEIAAGDLLVVDGGDIMARFHHEDAKEAVTFSEGYAKCRERYTP